LMSGLGGTAVREKGMNGTRVIAERGPEPGKIKEPRRCDDCARRIKWENPRCWECDEARKARRRGW